MRYSELPNEEKRRVHRAVLRLVLGSLQIGGATCAMILLLHIGAHPATFITTAATLATTIASRIIFRRDNKKDLA